MVTMVKPIAWMCFSLALLHLSSAQDLAEVIRTVAAIDTKFTNLLRSLNRSVSSCCQCSSSSGCSADNVYRNAWKLAFRGTAGIRKSVLSAYKDGQGIPANVEYGCKQVGQNLPCANHYRNNAILDNWKDISQVALVLYKDNVKVKQVIFDGAGSNYLNWLTKARVLDSSWSDMKSQIGNIFSIEGDIRPELRRVFLLNSVYGGCPNDVGWFVAIDKESDGCGWANNPAFPVFKYARTEDRQNWNSANIGNADYFAIFVRGYNLP
ncbi:hypothetical protein BgiMline_016964 [Biomphalaria glabrata]|nr:hypothetical protein BgiMline_009715 [Biomphalaria glabrata]